MFKPIIEVIRQQQEVEFEDDLLRTLETYGFHVDVERLTLALTDAKRFYDEGYRAAATAHGHWVLKHSAYGMDECDCSNCKQNTTTGEGVRMRYCPNCGANMEVSPDAEQTD